MQPVGTGRPSIDPGDAFSAVYAEQRLAIVRLAYLLVRSRPVAEELAQEAFLRLYANFASVESPSGFLRTTVVRLASTWRSRRDMERERLTRLPVREPDLLDEPDEVWTAIGRLRPERATVLVLRFYEDLPHADIATIVGCSTATVRSRVRRALRDLSKELEP